MKTLNRSAICFNCSKAGSGEGFTELDSRLVQTLSLAKSLCLALLSFCTLQIFATLNQLSRAIKGGPRNQNDDGDQCYILNLNDKSIYSISSLNWFEKLIKYLHFRIIPYLNNSHLQLTKRPMGEI